jgi:hypothetical protein
MSRIRDVKKHVESKLRQKINALSRETLKWHKKYLNSENEKAYRMKEVEVEVAATVRSHEETSRRCQFIDAFWAMQFQALYAENIRLRTMLEDA